MKADFLVKFQMWLVFVLLKFFMFFYESEFIALLIQNMQKL